MDKKIIFVKEIETALTENNITLSEDAQAFFDALKTSNENKGKLTENGKMILTYMKNNKEAYNNTFSAKAIGEGMSISSRTASGALRKLSDDGYCDKLGVNPVLYSITPAGEELPLE